MCAACPPVPRTRGRPSGDLRHALVPQHAEGERVPGGDKGVVGAEGDHRLVALQRGRGLPDGGGLLGGGRAKGWQPRNTGGTSPDSQRATAFKCQYCCAISVDY